MVDLTGPILEELRYSVQPEDRVVTSTWLAEINAGLSEWAQLGPGHLEALDPLGLHVAIPAGHVHHGDEEAVLFVRLLLHTTESTEPVTVPVMMPIEMFEALPTAFSVLARVAMLVPSTVADLDLSLCGIGFDLDSGGDHDDR